MEGKSEEPTYNGYNQYVEDVLSGKITACKTIILACERFKRLKEKYDFRPDKVDKVINFIRHLHHFQGKAAGKPFILEPWQEWIIASIFGFYKEDGSRLTREAVIEVVRKVGKTALAAAIALYCLLADDEQGGEVDFMANSVKQAHIAYNMSKTFAGQLDPKHKHMRILRDTLEHYKSHSILQVLATDTAALDGYNSSLTVLDECHSMPTSALYDVMKSSQGFRENPLTILITTAGDDTDLWYYSKRATYLDILHDLKEDDGQFICIYSLDKDDDIHDQSVWIKACPNLGVTVTKSYLQDRVKEADNDPQSKKSVLVKQFNMWQEDALDAWIPDESIREHTKNIPWDEFIDKVTWVGIDLSQVSDLTAASFMYKEDNLYRFKNLYWLPESALKDPNNGSRWKQWYNEGYLTITPGNVTDYDYILNEILKLRDMGVIFDSISYDSYNATQFAIAATAAGLPMVPFAQSLSSFNRPTKEFQRLLLQDRVILDNNPVTRWCFGNAVIKEDHNNNYKPIKRGGTIGYNAKKIDGTVVIVEALGGYLESNTAKYEFSDLTV